MKQECSSCNKEIVLQKVKDNFNLCYHCNFDLSNMLKKLKVASEKVKQEISKPKITGIPDNIQSDKIDEYPALSFTIGLYSILSIIGLIASIFIFGISIYHSGFTLEALLIMGCTWIGLIILYSYTELIKIFIRIEKNTRK